MNFQQFATTGFGTSLWMAMGHLPTGVGHALARVISGILYRRKEGVVYRTLYANQRGVLGSEASPERVDAAVAGVFRHAAMSAFDMVHAVAGGETAIARAIAFPPEFMSRMDAARAAGRGVLVCGAHLSAFNLAFLAFALRGGFPIQVLSAAMTGGGFRTMSELRNRGMFEETPIDAAALRKAILRLRQGGVVLLGVDWPAQVPPEEYVPFFGRPARLSTGYVRVAMSANALILPLSCRWEAGVGYYAMNAPHLELELTGDRDADIRHNARRVLAVAEQWIRETPDQWLMYHRVWPDA